MISLILFFRKLGVTKITILGTFVLSWISKVSQVVPSLVLVVNYLGVTSYMSEYEFPSHA
jgi:hypothetical protein